MAKKSNIKHVLSQDYLAGKSDELHPDLLLLDSDNPRLADKLDDMGEPSQEDICAILWAESETSELVMSIAYNSFFKNEPLMIVPYKDHNGKETGKFIVVEGNRRLAAVKILLDDELRAKLKATDVPAIDDVAKQRLLKLPVLVFDTREELWPYLGFRHINGPQPWDPYSKAIYIAEVHEKQRIPLNEIARRIGDRNVTVKRLYRGLIVLRQAEEQLGFNRDDANAKNFNFSHLYTALDYKEFRQHLGLGDDADLPKNPVSKSKLNNLRELMRWLYGSKSQKIESVIKSQNPDLGNLRQTIAIQDGLDNLRARSNLKEAYEAALGDELIFRSALQDTKASISIAVGRVSIVYKGQSDMRRTVRDIAQLAQKLAKDIDELDLNGQQKLNF